MTSQLKYKPYFIYKITGRLNLFFTNLQDAIELKDKIIRNVKIPENFEIILNCFENSPKNSSVIKNNRLFKKPSISELDKMINDKRCYWNYVSLIILSIRVKFNRYDGYWDWEFWEKLAKYLNNLEDFILYDFNITPHKRSEILTKRVDGGLGDVEIFLANKEEKEKD